MPNPDHRALVHRALVHRAYDLRTLPDGQIRGICVNRVEPDSYARWPVTLPDYEALKQLLSEQIGRDRMQIEVRLNGNLV